MAIEATDGNPKKKQNHPKRPEQGYFVQRMLREGKHNAWQARMKELMDEGMYARPAWFKSAEEFGWVDFAYERKLWEEWEANRPRTADMIQKEFEDALAELPPNTDEIVENQWVKAHPALSRKNRMKDSMERVIITRNDLFRAKHGRCPSASAANKLQHWANKPDEIYKKLTDVMKKNDGGSDEKAAELVEPTIDEIRRMLKEFSSG